MDIHAVSSLFPETELTFYVAEPLIASLVYDCGRESCEKVVLKVSILTELDIWPTNAIMASWQCGRCDIETKPPHDTVQLIS